MLMNGVESIGIVRKISLSLECAILFLGLPAAVAAGWLRVWVIALLVFMAIGCALALQQQHKIVLRDLLRCSVPKREWRRICVTYAVAMPCLVALLWTIKPTAMWSLMCQHTKIWLLVMFAYPLVSVFPQELIYRAFFFERYRPLFGSGIGVIFASAAVFSFAHVVFHNWLAVALTFIGGCLFAKTYLRTSSLTFVSIEHALYGCAIFTIGFGEFFFDGTMRLFR